VAQPRERQPIRDDDGAHRRNLREIAAPSSSDRRLHRHIRGVDWVHPDDLQRAFAAWWEPEDVNLRLDGRMANALPGWDLLAAEVDAAVLNADETPYVVNSSDPDLARVLADEWPHDEVLAKLP
jgi:hypothetical protein